MPTEEIPFEEWRGFFDQFSRRHEGWRATVEVLGNDLGAEIEARDQPLVGITADVKDRERAIAVILGEKGTKHLTHIIAEPKYVRLKRSDEGADEALAIESVDGITTLVCFRAPMRPEALNDVA